MTLRLNAPIPRNALRLKILRRSIRAVAVRALRVTQTRERVVPRCGSRRPRRTPPLARRSAHRLHRTPETRAPLRPRIRPLIKTSTPLRAESRQGSPLIVTPRARKRLLKGPAPMAHPRKSSVREHPPRIRPTQTRTAPTRRPQLRKRLPRPPRSMVSRPRPLRRIAIGQGHRNGGDWRKFFLGTVCSL